MPREGAACSEHMKREGRGYEVQLTALTAVCVFSRTGLLPCTAWGLWQLLSSCPPRAVWPLGAGELLCCAPQLQLNASSQFLVVHPTGAAQASSEHCSECRIYSNHECAVKNRQLFVGPALLLAEFEGKMS